MLWSTWKHQPVGDFSAFTAAKEHPDEYILNMGSLREREEKIIYIEPTGTVHQDASRDPLKALFKF